MTDKVLQNYPKQVTLGLAGAHVILRPLEPGLDLGTDPAAGTHQWQARRSGRSCGGCFKSGPNLMTSGLTTDYVIPAFA